MYAYIVCGPVARHVRALSQRPKQGVNQDPQVLELQTVVSAVWILGTEPRSSERAASA